MLVVDIVKKTLLKAQREKVAVTPDVYARIFCQIAKQEGLHLLECTPAQKFITKLDGEQKEEAQRKNIETLEDLIIFLINSHKREIKLQESKLKKSMEGSATQTCKLYGSIIKEALTPSFTKELDKKIKNTADRLSKHLQTPGGKLIDDLYSLIYERIDKDRGEVLKHAGDVENSVDNILESINTLISSGKIRSESVKELKKELEEMGNDKIDIDNFVSIKEKLSIVATSLNSDLLFVIKDLESKKTEIESLKASIAKLQADLKEAERQSKTDFLTGTLTKRGLDEELQKRESEFERKKREYAVVFFDIDHFKKVNDTYGHDVGDMILKTFSKTIAGKLRKQDILGRFGGEEFVAVLPEISKKDVVALSERIRMTIEKSVFEYKDKNIKITVSGGIALRSENEGMRMTVKDADEKLYVSKKSGRNRITH